jgi:hypothetical protein
VDPTVKKTKAIETKGVKAFRLEKNVLSTGGIGARMDFIFTRLKMDVLAFNCLEKQQFSTR